MTVVAVVTVNPVGFLVMAKEPRPENVPLPIPLHPTHGQMNAGPLASVAQIPAGGVNYGGLNPKETRFFDVIQMEPGSPTTLQIYPSDAAPYGIWLDPRRYVLTLKASGQDAISAELAFVVDVDALGKPEFSAEDSPAR